MELTVNGVIYHTVIIQFAAVWHSGNGVGCINKVTLRWARLVPGWVTIFGWLYHLDM